VSPGDCFLIFIAVDSPTIPPPIMTMSNFIWYSFHFSFTEHFSVDAGAKTTNISMIILRMKAKVIYF
jgi:hypothetical protein